MLNKSSEMSFNNKSKPQTIKLISASVVSKESPDNQGRYRYDSAISAVSGLESDKTNKVYLEYLDQVKIVNQLKQELRAIMNSKDSKRISDLIQKIKSKTVEIL
jgi:hypothetical protein